MPSEDEILDYLQLINTENIGPKTFSQLTSQFGSVKQALQNLPARYKPFERKQAEKELKLAKHLEVQILTDNNPQYPQALLNIPDYPPVLYAKGNIELLNNHTCVAIVGSRSASINGRKLSSKIAYDLTEQGIIVTSGMARGIDSAAHKGAMYACNKNGPTIAVLGTGVDIPYPTENNELYQQIIRQGCIISEFPLGTKPQSGNFPRRNRLISGLSCAVLVTEANLHSGSLITAYTALEQGKEIMAIPGSPLEGRSQGTNKLIKEGAILIENADDIINNLKQNTSAYTIPRRPVKIQPDLHTIPLDNETKIDNIPQKKTSAIIDFITVDGVIVDDIIEVSGIDSATVNAELLYLELEGKISRQPGNKVALSK